MRNNRIKHPGLGDNMPNGITRRKQDPDIINIINDTVVYWYIPVMHGDLKVTFENII
jgi:hypothetical protein